MSDHRIERASQRLRDLMSPPEPVVNVADIDAGEPVEAFGVRGSGALFAVGRTRALALIIAALLIVGGWWWWEGRSSSVVAPTAVAEVAQSGTPVGASSAPPAGDVVVDIRGDVVHPGVFTLPAGSRVTDVIKAAGGLSKHGRAGAVNLAAVVVDGQQIIVGGSDPVAVGDGGGGASGGLVNLNSATVEQLDTLPGVGPVLAQRIIDWRTSNGPFTNVVELQEVSGIGDATYQRLSSLVTVS